MNRPKLSIVTALGLALLAASLASAQEVTQPRRQRAAPELTEEQKAQLERFRELHKDARIARLELALLEAKDAPEEEIALKAEENYRLQGRLHAFRVKHPELTRHMERQRMRRARGLARGLARGQGHGWGGRGMGRGRQRGRGTGLGLGLGPMRGEGHMGGRGHMRGRDRLDRREGMRGQGRMGGHEGMHGQGRMGGRGHGRMGGLEPSWGGSDSAPLAPTMGLDLEEDAPEVE